MRLSTMRLITALTLVVLPCYLLMAYTFDLKIKELEAAHDAELSAYEETIQDLEYDVDKLEASFVDFKHYRVKITYYVPSAGGINSYGNRKKTATGGRPIPGKTAAVSRDLKHLLHKRVYIPGKGVFYVNDLTAIRNPFTGKRIRRQIDICVRRLSDVPEEGIFRNVPVAVKI